MVGWTCCGAERFHFLNEEGQERLGVDERFGFLIEIGLVGRAAAFGDEEEVVFVAVDSVEVDLRGEVAAGVDFVVHVEGRVLRVAQIVLSVGEIDAFGYALFVVAAGVDVLAFLADADGRAGVLAEGELTFCSYFGVAEHREGDEFVVLACFGVVKDLGHHFVVLAAQHECVVVSGLTGEHGESFGINHEDVVAAPVFDFHIVGCEMIVFRVVFRHGEHFLIVERFGRHNY